MCADVTAGEWGFSDLLGLFFSVLFGLVRHGVRGVQFSIISRRRITEKKFSALLGYWSEFESLGIYRFPFLCSSFLCFAFLICLLLSFIFSFLFSCGCILGFLVDVDVTAVDFVLFLQ